MAAKFDTSAESSGLSAGYTCREKPWCCTSGVPLGGLAICLAQSNGTGLRWACPVPAWRKELLGLAPAGNFLARLKQGQESWEGLPLPTWQQSQTPLPDQVGGLQATRCRENLWGCIASEGDGVFGALENSQTVGLREDWGGIFHLPFLLSIELHVTLAPLASSWKSFKLLLCFCLRGQ